MVIQQTSKFSDVFVGLDVVLQIRVFQLLYSFQDIIALIAQMVHVWVVIGEFGAGHSGSEHVVLTRNGDWDDWYRISFITKTDSIFLRFRSVGGEIKKRKFLCFFWNGRRGVWTYIDGRLLKRSGSSSYKRNSGISSAFILINGGGGGRSLRSTLSSSIMASAASTYSNWGSSL